MWRPKLLRQARKRLPLFLTVQHWRAKKGCQDPASVVAEVETSGYLLPVDELLIGDSMEKKKRIFNPVAHDEHAPGLQSSIGRE